MMLPKALVLVDSPLRPLALLLPQSSAKIKIIIGAWFHLEPTVGIPQINSLYVVNNCQHPNAAKLLIRFMMGGTDGDTSGNDPFNTLGGWPIRDDIEPAEGSVPLEDWNLIHVSTEDIYYNINKVRDFWTTLG